MVGWGPVGIGYVRPVQFLDHLTVIKSIKNTVIDLNTDADIFFEYLVF